MHHTMHFIPSFVKHNEALIMDGIIPNLQILQNILQHNEV